MDTLLALKPILTALALPATSGLLVLFALFWAWHMPRSVRQCMGIKEWLALLLT